MKTKKTIINLIAIFLLTISFTFLFSKNSYAYIDPSALTYSIQAIAGVAIAIGAFIGIIIRKIRKKMKNKFGIDEYKNKEVESDELIINKTDDEK